MKPKGIKRAAGLTKHLDDFGCREYVQVDYDTETNELYSEKHASVNSWNVWPNNPEIIHVANYYRPATMNEIEADLEFALSDEKKELDEFYKRF